MVPSPSLPVGLDRGGPGVGALREHRLAQAADRVKAGPSWQEFGLVFCTGHGTPIQPDNVNRFLTALCERAGVRRIPVHGLRHTCATLLIVQGVPARVVMDILGHSQISVTMNIYTDVLPAAQEDAMTKLDELFGGDVLNGVVNGSEPDAGHQESDDGRPADQR